MPIRVLIVDDHCVVRSGLVALLNSEPGLEVVGEAIDGKEALKQVQEHHPDVVLMDISMSGMNGLEATRRIKSTNPDVQILILTVLLEREMVQEALQNGASGYVPKQAQKSELVNAIHAVRRGEVYIHSMMTRALLTRKENKDSETVAEYQPLTKRENQVLRLIVRGYTNAQVAEQLDISERTVEFHRKNIMIKLNLHNRVGLVRYAAEKGLI